MPEGKKSFFTSRDIFFESALLLLHTGNSHEAVALIVSGIRYNRVYSTNDPEKIAVAYAGLHLELKLFKKNFLNRGKEHW